MPALIRRSPLVAFFALAYGLTWALWLPAAPFLQGLGEGRFPPAALLAALVGGYGPTAAAIVVAAAQGGWRGVKRLLAHFLVWRVAPVWYALIVLVPLATTAGAVALHVALGGAAPTGLDLGRWYLLLPAMLLALPLGPLAEETGWRGFALPRLQARFGPLGASLALGVLWACWHLPAFFIPGAALPLGAAVSLRFVAWYVLSTVAVTIFFTWVYNNTKRSLLIDVVFHTAINSAPAYLVALVYPGGADAALAERVGNLGTVLMCAVAVALVVATRGRLGAPPAHPGAAHTPAPVAAPA